MALQQPTENAHWRDSARPARFFFIDANAAFPLLVFLVHIKLWTFILAVIVMTFFTLLSRYGYTVDVFLRILRSTLAGPRKMAIPWWTDQKIRGLSMDLTSNLCVLAKTTNANFTFCGKPISYEEVFAEVGLLPSMAQRADKMCSLCLGYGIGATFTEAEKALLGVRVQFDDITPDILRLMYIYDVILEIIKAASTSDQIPLDELMYDQNMTTKYSDLQELVKYCDSAVDNLSKLHEQLVKIIAVKKNLSTSAGSDMVLSQAQNIADAIINLEKIKAGLSDAIKEAKQLGQRVQLLSQVSNNVAIANHKAASTDAEDQKEQQIMEEQKLLTLNEIAKKMGETIDNLLTTGDWENSIFLKASAAKLRELRVEAQRLSLLGGQTQQEQKVATVADKTIQRRAVSPGYSQVFILLYQVDSANLQEWYRTIKTLTDYSVTRPAYKDEAHAKEFIRSKASGVERNGYAVVNIKNDDFYNAGQPPVDACGHRLFALKENSIKLENIVEFVLANKQHYAIRDEALFLLGEEQQIIIEGYKGMAEQQQQQGQDNSLDFLWIVGILIGLIYLGWYFGRVHIVSAVFFVRSYEIIAANFVFDMLAKLVLLMGLPAPQSVLNEWLVFIQQNKGAVDIDFSVLVKLSTVVGNYIRYPLTVLTLGAAALLYFGSASTKVRRVFDNKSLRIAEQDNWPQIKPILGVDLVKQKLDEGPWAISLSPMRFCKKHDLLDVEEKYGKYIATLRRGAAYRLLSLQLGSKWCGAEKLPPYLKALFAIFAAKINGDKKSAENMLDQIAVSSAGKEFNFAGVEELMHKYLNSKKVVNIVSLHGYVTTVLASMLVGARSAGVLATAEFLWLKPIDRRMWYMLNSVGRQTAVAEISGAFAHWLAEKKLGLPLMVPMVEEAVRGLELALTEMVYKPDEEE